MITLDAQARDGKTNPVVLRKAGKVPAIVYGPKTKPVSIAVDRLKFQKVMKEAGESTVFTLKVGDKNYDVLLHDVSFDPVTDAPIHSDFYAFDKDQKVEVDVPLEFVGVAPAVKELGGTLVKVLHSLAIEGLPKDLPHKIEVDIAMLVALDSRIAVKDLKLPTGVVAKIPENEAVASITVQEEEKEEAPVAIDLEAIEVEKKGKKDEEGGDVEAAADAGAKAPAKEAPKK